VLFAVRTFCGDIDLQGRRQPRVQVRVIETLTGAFGARDLLSFEFPPQETRNFREREEIILIEYRKAIEEDMGAKYIIPIRVEHEDQRKASHYFIHATRHPLGFKS
jgi:hypothetical protein